MEKFDKDLWDSFMVEADESLKNMETTLIEAESGELDEDDVGSLFREIHSFKGAAKMLGMDQMGDLSHQAEDLLVLVRNGQTELDGPLCTLLLKVLDELKRLCNMITEANRDLPADSELLDELKRSLQQRLGEENVKVKKNLEEDFSDHMAALIEDLLPDLFLILGPDVSLEPAAFKKATSALDTLHRTAQVMNFHTICQKISTIKSLFPKEGETLGSENRDQLAIILESLKKPIDMTENKYIEEPVKAIATDDKRKNESQKISNPNLTSTNTKSGNLLRVSGETLDQFMNQIGEAVLIRSMLSHAVHDEEVLKAHHSMKNTLEKWRGRGKEFAKDLDAMMNYLDVLNTQRLRVKQVDQQLQGVLGHLQEEVMELRVVPIETVFNRFRRVVRDISKIEEKEVNLKMTGLEVRIDKGMVEVLIDPLMHMVRNSVDHGVEHPKERKKAGKPARATVTLGALQQGNYVIISVTDDGQGMDPEKIKNKAIERGIITEEDSKNLSKKETLALIFTPGFSTAETLTDISGRGVGMDVVYSNVMKLGGDIDIQSELGKGSSFILRLPLSAAIQETLMVEAAGQTLAIPERYISEILEIPRDQLQSVKGRPTILLRDSFLPICYLASLLGKAETKRPENSEMSLVVLSNGKNRIGIEVDRLNQRHELFVKDIHPQLAALPGVGGASILGDGRVVLILDGEELFRLAEKMEKESKEVA